MNRYLKKILILTVALAMVLTLCSAFGFAEEKSSDSGELVVKDYSITDVKGNPVSLITKGQTVNITLYMKHTTRNASGLNDNMTIDRRADSFSGGQVRVTDINSAGLLEVTVQIKGLKYKGTGNTLKLLAGYWGSPGQQDYVDVSITECKEYEEPTYEPTEPSTPDPLPAPKAIISRSELASSIKANQEITVTVYVKNIGSTTMQSPVIQFTPSDSLMLPGSSSMMQLKNIAPGKTESVDVRVRALGTITGANQSLDATLTFDYFNRVSTVSGSSEGKIIIPAKVKKTDDESQEDATVDSPVPNIIITGFDYGGESVAAGSAFGLNIKFMNTNRKLSVENLVVTIDGGEGFAINGSTNTFYFDKIKPGKTKQIHVPMKALNTLTNGVQPVTASFKYEYVDHQKRSSVTSDLKVSIPVYQPDKFEITKPTVPVVVYAGEETSLSLNYVNKSKGEISNVEASIEGDVDTAAPVQNIGNLEAGKSGTIAFAVTPSEPGETRFTIKVTYEDGNGTVKTRVFPVVMNVEEMEPIDPGMDEPMPEEDEGSGVRWPIIIGIAVLALIAALLIIKKKKKAAAARKEAEMWDNWDDDEDISGKTDGAPAVEDKK